MELGLKHLSDRALYKEYKNRINPRDVLDYYGAENTSEKIFGDGTTEILHSCLLDRVERHHTNGDMKPSAVMNLDHKLYVCYSWLSCDIFHFIMKMEKKEYFSEIIRFIQPFLSGSASEDPENFKKELERLFDQKEVYSLELPSYSERILKPWLVSHPYLREDRGVSLEASSRLMIGWDSEDNRLVFPHFFQGKLVGWQKRAIPSSPLWPGTLTQIPKYKSNISFPKSHTLYNYDRAIQEKSVLVVESPMSVAKAYSLGLENVVATFGGGVTKNQAQLLRSFDEVIVWMDRDDAGYKGERLLVQSLYNYCRVRVVEPEKKKDLADSDTIEEVQAKLESASPAFLKLAQYGGQK